MQPVRRSASECVGGEMIVLDVMTPEEFRDTMLTISKYSDKEDRHYNADELMCDLLHSLGYGEGVAIFKEIDKWYA